MRDATPVGTTGSLGRDRRPARQSSRCRGGRAAARASALLFAAGTALLGSLHGCNAAVASGDAPVRAAPGEPSDSTPDSPPERAPESPPEDGPRVGASVAAGARAVVEGQTATFVVTVSGTPRAGPVTVSYAVSGTATAGSDYEAPSGTVTLAAGAAQGEIAIATLTDGEDEPVETIVVVLERVERATAAAAAVEVDSPRATVSVAEPGTVIVAVESATVAEGGAAAFAVTASERVPEEFTVGWKTGDETALAGSDYTAETGGTVTFASGGAAPREIRVATLRDDLEEPDETFRVELTGVHPPGAALLGRAVATGTITDVGEPAAPPGRGPPAPRPRLPEIRIADGVAFEGDGTLRFPVTLTPGSYRTVTVDYATEGATAGAGSDFESTGGTLSWTPHAPGEALAAEENRFISVPILQDEDKEPDETFTVRLSGPANATLAGATATGTVIDDDEADDTRATATAISQGDPVSSAISSATDVDYHKLTVTVDGTVYVAIDAGRVGQPGYRVAAAVSIETADHTSSNSDAFDQHALTMGTDVSKDVYVRVTGTEPTRYDVAVWFVPAASEGSETSFDIDLRFLGTPPTAAQKNAIRAAADIWEGAITAGLPDARIISSHYTWKCRLRDPSTFGESIDDLRIDVRLESIDGDRGFIARAGPCVIRDGGMAMIGSVRIDTAELATLDSTFVQAVMVHEIAHVLGFGTHNGWESRIRERSAPTSSPPPDTHFIGTEAVAAFDELLGDATYSGKKVPVENADAWGLVNVHWRESVFDTELMTPRAAAGASPLSKVTLAALADIGYSVDYTQAESYTLPSTSTTSEAQSKAVRGDQVLLHFGDDIRRGPIFVAKMPR